jgi:hypothetical protein
MDSSDLFSQPYKPQVDEKRGTSAEPTMMPAFSDEDQKKSSSSKPSS